MTNQMQQEPSSLDNLKTGLNLFAFICDSFAATAIVFLRRDFGERFLGFQALGGVFCITFYGAACRPQHHPEALGAFLLMYIVLCVLSRIGIVARLKRGGPQPHSRFSGRSWLAKFFPRMGELTLKGTMEPIAVLLIGTSLCPLSEALGGYLIITAFAMMMSVGAATAYLRARAMELNDAAIEAEQLAEQLRQIRGGRF